MAELVTYSRETILEQLSTRLGLTNANRDSFARIISEVIGSELEAVERELLSEFRNEQIENLSGDALEDNLFNAFNITRFPARHAKSEWLELTAYAGDSFGEINNDSDIIVPAGTRISLTPFFDSVNFVTTEEVVLSKDSTVAYVEIIAENPGSSYNCTEESLRYIDFVGYSQSEIETLKIRNIYDISNGSNKESDFSLRLRGLRFLESRSVLNKSALFAGILNEPSIFDFELIESYYGIGTLGVVVKGHGYGQVSDEDLAKVQQIISEFKFPGQAIEMVLPREVILTFDLNLVSKRPLNEQELAELENTISNFIRDSLKEMEFRRAISLKAVYDLILTNFNVQKPSGTISNFTNMRVNKIERFETASAGGLELNPNSQADVFLGLDETLATPKISINISNPKVISTTSTSRTRSGSDTNNRIK